MEIIVNPNYKPVPILTTGLIMHTSGTQNWQYKIVIKDKALVAFPKFNTMAIGFENGEWDLPHDCTVKELWWIIKSDRGNVRKAELCEAIQMLKDQLEADEQQYSREEKRASEAFFDYNHGG